MKKLLLILLLFFPVLAFGQASPPSTYVPQLITYPGVPFGVCSIYQIAENVSNGNYYTCNPATYTWLQAGNSILGNNNAFTGNNTHSGTETFKGQILCTNLENVLCVDAPNSAGWAAAANCTTDLNVCLAAAYTALGSTGGRIKIAASTSTYNQATAFTAATAGKPVLIECDPGGATVINWTPSSGTAFTFDTRANTNQHPVGMGMRDCVLTTNAGSPTSTAIALGSANSGEGYEIARTHIEKFQTGASIIGTPTATGSFANMFLNDVFLSLTYGIVGSGSVELTKIIGGSFFGVGTAISGTGDYKVEGASCDDPGAGSCIGNGVNVTWTAGHFENPGLGLPTYVNSTGIVTLYGGLAEDDVTTGTNTTPWFTNAGVDSMIIDGLEIATSGRAMGTNPVVSFGANGRGALRIYDKNPSSLTPLYSNNAFQFNKIVDMSYDVNGTIFTAALPGPIKTLEVAAPSGISATDFIYGDSTAHKWKANNNNGGAVTFAYIDSAQTWSATQTNMPLATPTISLLTNGTGIQVFNTTTTCTTAGSVGATCTTGAISLPVAEADTSYRVTCTGKGPTAVPVISTITNSSATQFTITIAALTAVGASFTSFDCIAGHN
jgi:hypothetical protein